ncbi:MAG TPA: DUF4394 domain-containing protein [Noviherbaspirillum sp.]|uniref:DUF4394 domain-containing protein n=1 Tax=Noviherbaspirillum sp. TaxID=1926288 RepID=UPI002DDD7741|nr:DUF4394 domain-containing protein [Noviherbaspirillum sp.]HEV2613010.1 DUF4394 domain-containing protein [Noviherbaspirillum sp.]
MNKYARPVLLAALAATLLPSHATNDEYRDSKAQRNGHAMHCESGDEHRRGEHLQVVALTDDQRLICFSEHKPDHARNIGSVSGLMSGDALVGIDYRVQDGKLYGVSKTGGIYVLDTRNASAAKVSQLTVALEGTSFGVDFNPAADRLRVVSDTGQNLRHNVNAGGATLVDDPLDYPPATPLNAAGPNATGVTGSAYTNNDLNAATATTLYALDATLDQVALQSPPNDGTLAATGKLGTDTAASVGFDIYSTVRDGVTVDVQGLASLHTSNGATGLYSINLATGKATARGHFAGQNKVIGIAIPLNQL